MKIRMNIFSVLSYYLMILITLKKGCWKKVFAFIWYQLSQEWGWAGSEHYVRAHINEPPCSIKNETEILITFEKQNIFL